MYAVSELEALAEELPALIAAQKAALEVNQYWEIPRLCRGDSKSLTIRGVHQETDYREPPSTR